MQKFADWLPSYDDFDVTPGFEGLEKMRSFYTAKGIDILKDAVSFPGVSLHYLSKGTIEEERSFTALAKRPHRFKQPKVCKRIIGYDVNHVKRNKEGKDHTLSKSCRHGAYAYRTPVSRNLVWVRRFLNLCSPNRFQMKLCHTT